mgnify:CR=1 FL=1
MWKQKLCLGTSEKFGISEEEQIALMKKTGFDGFFCTYENGKDLVKLSNYADELGMYFQSVHAPFVKMNKIWSESVEEDEFVASAFSELINCIDESARAGVPIVVMHAFIGFRDHSPNAAGIERLSAIIKRAKDVNVKIAFENTEGEEYLAAIMNAFKDEKHVGFCWDTGHELCYNHGKNMLELYGDRLFCTHLNDNLGIRDYLGEITSLDDLHLLPFDGISDWNDIAQRLNKYGFNEELTFELSKLNRPGRHENDLYEKMSLEEYFAEAYKHACKFAAMKLKV